MGEGGPSQVLVVQEFGVLPGLPEAVETEVKILLNHLFAYMGGNEEMMKLWILLYKKTVLLV